MTKDAWNSPRDDVWKTRENRLRRVAVRRGYAVTKVRRMDRNAIDYGKYTLSSTSAATASSKPPEGVSLEEAEAFIYKDNGK